MANTTNEVVETLNDALTTVETETSELAGGVRAVVPESEIGRVMGTLRRSEFEYDASRDGSGNLVVNIEAEEERDLGDLFR